MMSKLDICHDIGGGGGGGFFSSFFRPCLARKKNGPLPPLWQFLPQMKYCNIATLSLFDYSSAYRHPAGFFSLIAIARMEVAIWICVFLYLLVKG